MGGGEILKVLRLEGKRWKNGGITDIYMYKYNNNMCVESVNKWFQGMPKMKVLYSKISFRQY